MWPSTRSTRAALWRRLQEEFRSCSLAKKIEARSPCGPSRQTFTAEPEWYWPRIRQECLNHSAPAVEVAARAEVLAARVAVAGDAGALAERAALEVLEEPAALGDGWQGRDGRNRDHGNRRNRRQRRHWHHRDRGNHGTLG